MSDSNDELRIGTAEREAAVKILSDHLSEGRLTPDEYDQRTRVAVEARTRGDLRPLFRDLPAPYPAFLVPQAPVVPNAPPPTVHHPAQPPAEYSEKNRVVAGVLQIVLPFGIGRFYTGHTKIAVAQLLTMFIGVGMIWCLVDGVILLVNGGTDADGRTLRT